MPEVARDAVLLLVSWVVFCNASAAVPAAATSGLTATATAAKHAGAAAVAELEGVVMKVRVCLGLVIAGPPLEEAAVAAAALKTTPAASCQPGRRIQHCYEHACSSDHNM